MSPCPLASSMADPNLRNLPPAPSASIADPNIPPSASSSGANGPPDDAMGFNDGLDQTVSLSLAGAYTRPLLSST